MKSRPSAQYTYHRSLKKFRESKIERKNPKIVKKVRQRISNLLQNTKISRQLIRETHKVFFSYDTIQFPEVQLGEFSKNMVYFKETLQKKSV